jgi:hypothetical protein
MTPQQPPVLDYRHRGTGQAVSLERLVGLMEQRELALTGMIALKLFGGFLMLLAGPALLATVLTGIAFRFGIEGFPGWTSLFLITCLILIPWLCWYEWRTRGQFFLDFSRGNTSGAPEGGMVRTSSRGEWEIQTTTATWAAILEVLLFGPRLIFEGIGQYRARALVGSVDRKRAARLLWQLFVREEGQPVSNNRSSGRMEFCR